MNEKLDQKTIQDKFPEAWNAAVEARGNEADAFVFLTSENGNLEDRSPVDVINAGDGERVIQLIASGMNGLII